MNRINKTALILCLQIIFINLTYSGEPIKPTYVPKTPTIDGILEASEWDNTLSISDFRTYAPDYGFDVSEKTIVYLAYDSENLYFAFHCYDREPEKIKTSITSRDKIDTDDWVCINMDTFNDHQSLYAFYVNALGIQMDTRFTAGNEDASMDYVWYSAAKRDDKGYHVEVAIPLKSIRFSDGNPAQMAITVERNISRKSERATFPAIDPKKGMNAFLTQMQPLVYYDLKHSALLEILPAITYIQKYNAPQGSLDIEERKSNFSLTGKYGISSDLILDGTYNPDFSQVESDAGQVDVNLRYDLFYSEKRPFFLEGSENFKLGATLTSELDPIRTLVHTRMIIKPVAGIKLAGKIGEKDNLELLYAIDEIQDNGKSGKYAHFPIFRYKKSLDNDSYLGALYSGREAESRFNRVIGVDGVYRVTQSSLLEGNAIYSSTEQSDTTGKTNGHSIGIYYHNEDRDQDYGISVKDISKNFITESGYIMRNGIFHLTGLYRKRYYPGSELFRSIFLELFSGQTNDKYCNLWETYNHISIQGNMWNTIAIKIKYSYSDEVFLDKKFLTGGLNLLAGGQITKQFFFSAVYRHMNDIFYSSAPYQGISNRFTGNFIFMATEQLESAFDLTYYNFYDNSEFKKIYDYLILRGKIQYQFNKYLFLRGIVEYNDYRKNLLTDFLASFTYIPGTVVYLGYGSLYEKTEWENNRYMESNRFMETKRGFFFKASYLWRI